MAKTYRDIRGARHLFHRVKYDAKRRGIEWSIDFELFFELSQRNCYLCGQRPTMVAQDVRRGHKFTYNGLDRVDNSKPYTPANIKPCCWRCNNMKSNMTLRRFKNHIRRIISNAEIGRVRAKG